MLIFSEATLMACLPASSKPVVPMTIFLLFTTQKAICSKVPSGRVKSINTSKFGFSAKVALIATPKLPKPTNSPASAPIKDDPARSNAAVNSTPSN